LSLLLLIIIKQVDIRNYLITTYPDLPYSSLLLLLITTSLHLPYIHCLLTSLTSIAYQPVMGGEFDFPQFGGRPPEKLLVVVANVSKFVLPVTISSGEKSHYYHHHAIIVIIIITIIIFIIIIILSLLLLLLLSLLAVETFHCY
jgi:hypothetical protein